MGLFTHTNLSQLTVINYITRFNRLKHIVTVSIKSFTNRVCSLFQKSTVRLAGYLVQNKVLQASDLFLVDNKKHALEFRAVIEAEHKITF